MNEQEQMQEEVFQPPVPARKSWWKWAKGKVRSLASDLGKVLHGGKWDLLILAGFASVVVGLGMIYLPLAPIVGGSGFIYQGIKGEQWESSQSR